LLGAPGTPATSTAFDIAEGLLSPLPFVATTSKVYVAPFVRVAKVKLVRGGFPLVNPLPSKVPLRYALTV
jgi:hypothetical protein